MAERTWTCKRQSKGVRCNHVNPRRKLICAKCGKKRPATKKPVHMQALDLSYDDYIKINGEEICGICGRPPSPNRRLDRDHSHIGNGKPRGLLCVNCNRNLREFMTIEWLQNALNYLEKSR